LPPEIGQLTQLTSLFLFDNQLTALPPEIGQLTQLTELSLSTNKLTALPPEIGQLTQLTSLSFSANKLTALPPEIGQLTQLTSLDLKWNKLTALPPEIGLLTKLTTLRLESNKLTTLPPEIGLLVNLEEPSTYGGLKLDNNSLESPPPEIIKQGTKAILAYLQAQLQKRQKQWLSKLIIVGQGGVVKLHCYGCYVVNNLIRKSQPHMALKPTSWKSHIPAKPISPCNSTLGILVGNRFIMPPISFFSLTALYFY
jgi:hypothetical protein